MICSELCRVKVCVCSCAYVCISERRWYLGLCDESVLVAGKVLRAACRLLIHIRRGWLESVVDDTGRCWGKEQGRRERAMTNEQKLCAGMIPNVNHWQNKFWSISVTPWHPRFPRGCILVNNYTHTNIMLENCTLGREKKSAYQKKSSSMCWSVKLLYACICKISWSSNLSWRRFDLWAIMSSLKY